MYKSKWNESDEFATGGSDNAYLDGLAFNQQRKMLAGSMKSPHAAQGVSNSSMKMATSMQKNNNPAFFLKKDTMGKVSSSRMEYLQSVVDQLTLPGGGEGLTAPAHTHHPRGMVKTAVSGTTGPSSAGSTTHLGPDWYSPLWLGLNMQMPRDIRTANSWNRVFFESNPIVRNAINLHATYPISKLKIKCEDKKVEQFFLDMMDRIDLETVVQHAALEFWMLGECFIYADFDESRGEWSKIYIHNPDYINVKASPIPGTTIISLAADPQLEKIINSNDPALSRIRESLDPRIIEHVRRNEYIPLDNFNVSHLKNLSSPYDIRGTSIIVSVWKDLILYDKIRESKLVQADGMINPMTLVKVGSSNPDGHYPTSGELENYRNILEAAQYDKDFKLVTHDAVTIERVGYNGQVMDTASDLQFIIDNILMGLMVPKSILTQEGATYASASVALDVMRQRYNNFRGLMANWLEKKIFAPIAEVQGFYKPEDGVKRLIVPKVEWNYMTLYDLDNYLQHVTGMVEKQHVSVETVYRSLGLNKEEELANIRSEQIRAAILKRENEELAKMSLTELRALDPIKPVPERPRDALPGQMSVGPAPPPQMDMIPAGMDLGPMASDLGGMDAGPNLGPGGPGGDLGAPPMGI